VSCSSLLVPGFERIVGLLRIAHEGARSTTSTPQQRHGHLRPGHHIACAALSPNAGRRLHLPSTVIIPGALEPSSIWLTGTGRFTTRKQLHFQLPEGAFQASRLLRCHACDIGQDQSGVWAPFPQQFRRANSVNAPLGKVGNQTYRTTYGVLPGPSSSSATASKQANIQCISGCPADRQQSHDQQQLHPGRLLTCRRRQLIISVAWQVFGKIDI